MPDFTSMGSFNGTRERPSGFSRRGNYTIPALNDKEVSGYITDISSTATSGKFTVIVEYDNDGEIKLGMTVNITI